MAPSDTAHDLTLALTDVLRAVLVDVADSDIDPESLAALVTPALSGRLGEALVAAGASVPRVARALARGPAPTGSGNGHSAEERVLTALRRHSAGRSPGVTPESLVALTGLPQQALGPAVSALVQAGELVRDAWLVRLPNSDDLLPGTRKPSEERAGESRQVVERRAIGDRRALGERRLYERRSMQEG
jgi:hypothetical protein